MHYLGEHLLPGELGHFAVILSLVASLMATIAFFKANKAIAFDEKQSWLRFARTAFFVETVCVLTILGCIYYILANHLFEYKYAWEHSDKTLQIKYVFSCLWEGQEGSFLLWAFWHCALGWTLIFTAKKWEAGVLSVISFAQFCIATMMLGLIFFGQKIGTTPFILLRNDGILDNAPIFKDITTGALRSDYLSLLKDGSGLNTLLQNYWMVIHPPILFLGFASTIVPFAFAFTGLMNNDHSWAKTALPWAAFSGAVLGTGIMMGAAWAYESLSFGGYWAWDPVENASLVPWIVLVAGLHTNVIYKSTGYSLKSTYIFYILEFVLILYSTFLTRSGILGDTSVHAFVGADMTGQLVSMVLIFFIPAVILYFIRNRTIPTIKKEEQTYSREFWMFIGALVLCLSSIIIIAKTSLPVFNKIFGTKLAAPEDVKFSYNQIQIFIAIIIGILTAVTQYFRYKDTPKKVFGQKIFLPTAIALVISILLSIFGEIKYNEKGIGFLIAIHVALFAAMYALTANAMYIWVGLNGKLKAAGASVAHVGFALLLAGILISSSRKEVLSWNTTGVNILEATKDNNPAENITLFKSIRTDMGKYHVTYVRDSINESDHKKYFELKFENKKSNEVFYLYPDLLKNNKGQEGFAANPDKKHYWNKDIFVYVSGWRGDDQVDTSHFRSAQIKVGDTTFYSNGMIVLNKVVLNPADKRFAGMGDTTAALDMTVISKEGRKYNILPGFALHGNSLQPIPDTVIAQNLVINFNRLVDIASGKLEVGIKESQNLSSLVTLKVYEFPYINLVWIGVIIMVTGFLMTVRYRIITSRLKVVKPARKASTVLEKQ